MSVRLLLTDEVWAKIAAILATLKSRAGSPPTLSDRLFIEAVLYLARTGPLGGTSPRSLGSGTPSTTAFAAGKPAASGASSGNVSKRTSTKTPCTSLSMRPSSVRTSMRRAR